MQVHVHSNVKKHTADFFKFLPTIFVTLTVSDDQTHFNITQR